jgi:hypothetical protein
VIFALSLEDFVAMQIPSDCHSEWSEESCIFIHMQRSDFSASPRNDSCNTASERKGVEAEGDQKHYPSAQVFPQAERK